jgi:hypothetical protein
LPGSEIAPVLFTLDRSYRIVKKYAEIPPLPTGVIWAPDASGALVLGWHNELLFVRPDGTPLVDLRPILGEDANSFVWIR